ncbi:MAG: hypothetical protein KGJ23_05320 [Euryarchaeota archaeon]|nr:hypothetical protein [Euryarchaeota archaeon]MDE1836018.1 hypothetical protein [Euryarchaeota archaeon]MDE1882049.1 hypothetical protein [Euryarchaeota archaeon]MDE2046396.1 hypothetical protein [Thermoplasmata archaeon]
MVEPQLFRITVTDVIVGIDVSVPRSMNTVSPIELGGELEGMAPCPRYPYPTAVAAGEDMMTIISMSNALFAEPVVARATVIGTSSK